MTDANNIYTTQYDEKNLSLPINRQLNINQSIQQGYQYNEQNEEIIPVRVR
jgi:hypothetical protein